MLPCWRGRFNSTPERNKSIRNQTFGPDSMGGGWKTEKDGYIFYASASNAASSSRFSVAQSAVRCNLPKEKKCTATCLLDLPIWLLWAFQAVLVTSWCILDLWSLTYISHEFLRFFFSGSGPCTNHPLKDFTSHGISPFPRKRQINAILCQWFTVWHMHQSLDVYITASLFCSSTTCTFLFDSESRISGRRRTRL